MEKLYYTNQYIRDFTAEIIEIREIENKFHVLLDKTAFFPGGGGQFGDLGKIDDYEVISVYEEDKKVYHILDKKPIKIHKVKCSIDWDRREDGMHQHFGQHVLSGCFFKTFNANTTGFHLGNEYSTVDIDGNLDEEKIREIELLANEIIRQNIQVETLLPTKRELKKIWVRRALPNTNEEIRVVKIGDLDTNACCGVHPKSTSELRMIKIKKWEKHKSSTRIEFLAGKRAVDEVLKRDVYLTKICRYLSCSEEDAINGIVNLNEKVEDSLSKKRKLEEIVAKYQVKEMVENANKIGNVSVVKKIYDEEDLKYVNKIANKITEDENNIALLAVRFEEKINLIFACSKNLKAVNMGSLLKDAISLIDGKGGGSQVLAQGGGKNNGNLESTFDYAFMKLEKIL
ncbi:MULTISPECIES: DHHA1 domain-containing protein [unclassified Clostridioides]|uniref:DHHA1 domain-containing protein n=1 Tax=unclassified Clostridioides TaxID=2635829 RepID=UPI001D103588|nr:alanyl-tRNA editing protein AlaX-L [Clostridioides sp. ZZV14-6150]MCC0658690.1 alanyl-tRNA editing protein AlaX-L [Clostridioides sp. ZZV14-6154]MCC0668848.1 alanyl-tRNA editing protein AlaX-L [Clostridioides sp. ZZV14-6153]MCC0719734.1 alanyl-tRNA editing protein AlaX-L [Clostridioides sp. ZZV14-6105]MCC0721685.1 alanyl-tRNA editing protein AlaX-L [Clostridioides sp. ZZV14-6104]MCC0725131.1 alanyl-tRNA editing protein AlaX-L [Clostridioides sp. ZZV14-6045]MCC0731881.1 alanyl-tRNA editing 